MMSNIVRFPRSRVTPPAPTADALLEQLVAVELALARARLAQVRAETRYANALWFSYCLKRILFWGLALWLLTTVFASAAYVGTWRTFYGPNGNFVGSSSTPGCGRFTNYFDKNGRLVGTELRRGP